ncbi:alpha/beta fold hydrolase [Deinococcus soli (ex Cha et al. 2016)]|uniref:alpha/beta fold hydrolase n=1 Tax=Deinococcus soli (ex Cha et al. 2016) TaxID=1309411 RepID=UPI00166B3465|nr:alpha/beta hydrolase [Deinococcus soli (ex Cha et al. 2016)]GGB59058.1 arylesterase [Deinococcus soli (ex Cha et al. 2016)]
MPTIQTKHAHAPQTELYYETYGQGRPVVLIHGWPLSGRMWEGQIDALRHAGYQVVSYDRRGFGQSGKTATGYTYDVFASDLKDLLEELNLTDVTLVGFSMGGGEVSRYAGLYGTDRVRSAMLVASVAPYLLKTADNPDGGMTHEDVEGMVKQVAQNRPQFLAGFTKKFLNWDEHGAKLGDEFLDFAAAMYMQASPVATQECVRAFGETDFRADLARLTVPTLVVHGDKDQIVPLAASGQRVPQYAPNAELHVMTGAPHGLNATHGDEFNKILLDFVAR